MTLEPIARWKSRQNPLIDTYNHKITDDGIACCILYGVDFRNKIFVIVYENRNRKKETNKS